MVTCGMTLHLFRKLDGYDDLVKVINRRPTNPPLCAKEEEEKDLFSVEEGQLTGQLSNIQELRYTFCKTKIQPLFKL